ncbi:mechanosensitive ion channel family protein [Homoserinimonas sp. OAct 916]|uniref:mechanosensitive ion channel family protein n=1 Tax=Homoserinimonas sp. OAct 916 TaxID=2211450 RepID=UPI001E4A36AB|nr:mechanosensitive ion channel domain-containing protein [Homoserinimonas sp. OAct 916]
MTFFSELPAWLTAALWSIAAIVLSVVATYVFGVIFRVVGRGRPWSTMFRARMRSPLFFLLLVILLWIVSWGLPEPIPPLTQTFRIALILTAAWAVGSAAIFTADLALSRYALDGSDGWQARRARTQFQIVRRLMIAATIIVAVGAALLTFPGVQAVGAAVLASAGVVSVIAGLAAQSTLSNVFAGMQLAFSGSVRLEDVVVVQGEWGYIEEITLTYVVVRIWDERRLVMPSTYFTQQSYENWTRHSTDILGTVFFDLDWGVDIPRMREELDRILANTELWDGEAASLRVTETTGGYVQVRALVSAADSFSMFDLTRTVREEMLLWLQKHNPAGLPRTRIQAIDRDGESFPRTKAVSTRTVPIATGDEVDTRTLSIPITPAERDVLNDERDLSVGEHPLDH